ncbi:Uridine-cytidine kinase C [Cucurbita argyrosperma subsp. argyrosperma]|nr:Uridine-cytidine kinase C [Cucurbita argyrosperma subsp. argyrosperma]
MAQDTSSSIESSRRRSGLLRDQVQLVKKKDSNRYEILPIEDPLSFEKGFFIVIRACQLLSQKNDGIILVGVAGPSGAGKTVFTEKVLNFIPSIAVITMDNYNDSSRIIDDNFDDPRLTDYDTLLENIHGLREGKSVQVPIYDFKTSSRAGYRIVNVVFHLLLVLTLIEHFFIFYPLTFLLLSATNRTLEVPMSRIVIIEGIYALSEKLRPLLDLRVSITGGVHFDLVKRVLRDIQRVGQEPEEIIHQVSETVYPMYKAFIEPDLQTAHIRIINKFNPFTGFQNPTYILKSTKAVPVEQIKAVISENHKEFTEETYDIYLLPPGEDPEEWVTDAPFIISPRITFEVSVRLLGGLMALGYTIATILKRSSHIFSDDRVCIKIDWLEQLNRKYIQVQGKDRMLVKYIAEQLGLDGSYIPRTYIEQIQLEKLVDDVIALPDDLKTKLSIDDDSLSSPKEALSRASADWRNKYLNRDKTLSKLTKLAVNSRRFDVRAPDSPAGVSNQGAITQLSEQISTLSERMDEFTTRIEELNSKICTRKVSASQQNLASQSDANNNGTGATSIFISGLSNGALTGSLLSSSSSLSQLAKESPLLEEIQNIARGQRQIILQVDNLSNLLRERSSEKISRGKADKDGRWRIADFESISTSVLLTLAVGSLGLLLFKSLNSHK